MKHLSTSLSIAVQPKESSDAEAAEELAKWLEKIWRERTLCAGITDLRIETTEKRTTTPSSGTHALPEFPDQVGQSKSNDEHLVMDLPQQISKRVLLAKKSNAQKLRPQWQAEVAAAGGPSRDSSAGFVLKAWGSSQSLQQLRDLISDEAKAKPPTSLAEPPAVNVDGFVLAAGAANHGPQNEYRCNVFKNCSSASSPITFVNYFGPCQAYHDRYSRHLPLVRNPDLKSPFSRDKFINVSLQQLDRISSNYDETVHGGMRAVISYGTLYVANCSRQEVLEYEFDGLLEKPTNSDLARPRGRAGGRGRTPRWSGPGRNFIPQPKQYCHSSFIPTGNRNIDRSRLQAFLQDKGFVHAEDVVDYRLTLEKPHAAGKQMRKDMILALDESFEPTYANALENQWLCINIVSANKDSSYRPYDCRFKIISRINVTTDPLSESKDFTDIIAQAKHRTILLRTGNNEVYGVDPDFQPRIRFVRKKHTEVYRLAANQQDATTGTFLDGMAIRINYGTEYTRPSASGVFQDIDRDRVEVTVLPELPDLRDEDKMRTFLTECWKFAEELGSVLE